MKHVSEAICSDWLIIRTIFLRNIINHLNDIANVFTIAGVIFAIVIYFLWKRNYKIQKKHDFLIEIFKKITHLNLEIEILRAPKFCNLKTLPEFIESYYIPEIEKNILAKVRVC